MGADAPPHVSRALQDVPANKRPAETTPEELKTHAGSADKLDDDCIGNLDELDIFETVEQERAAHRKELAEANWLGDEERCLDKLGFESDSRGQALQLVKRLGAGCHVSEVFCPPRFTSMAHRYGLTPGIAFDLRSGWDLDDPQARKAVWEHLQLERPYLVVGSPECKAFTQLRFLNQDSPKYRETLAAGLRHLEFVCQI